jgi:murein DD-endopeptidase MepM/ murein hydrolase activator NlpD
VYDSLRQANLSASDISGIILSAREVHNIDRMAANTEFVVTNEIKDDETIPVSVAFKLSNTRELVCERDSAGVWSSKINEFPIDINTVTFSGVVESSLWESARNANMDTNLISALADIFAWQVDFAREVRRNDRWRLVVEEKRVNDKFVGWGNILVAEYVNAGTPYVGIRYPPNADRASYYALDGTSLRRMFLKSPVKFGRISSRFSNNRLHPVLKVRRPHNGVDYAAPIGTPIMSVGKGVVEFAGYRGQAGIMVKIRHNSTYSTSYSHMRNVARGIRPGVRVEQGQVIGYVGMTGLTSGPHCHFEFYVNGRFVDPLGRRFPAEDPVPPSEMDNFKQLANNVLPKLPEWDIARVEDGTRTVL